MVCKLKVDSEYENNGQTGSKIWHFSLAILENSFIIYFSVELPIPNPN